MAKKSSDGKSVTVEKGDTLGQIAIDYYGGYSNYKKLAALNNISNPDLIYIGQVIRIDGTSSSSTTTSSNSNCPTINHFGESSTNEGTLFAVWAWSKSNTKSYKVEWDYTLGDGFWYNGSLTENTVDSDYAYASKQSTYTVPSGAKKVRFRVKPISKTYTKNDKETNYWTANWTSYKEWTNDTPITAPSSAPSVEIKNLNLTAELDNLTMDATHIQFQVVKDNAATVFASNKAKITSGHASYSCKVSAGSEFKVRCRACKGSSYSEWTDYSNNTQTIPAAPSSIVKCQAESETSVYLQWRGSGTDTSYDIEYAEKKEYLGKSDQAKTVTGIETTQYYLSGLESGHTYYFRVRAKNDAGESSWTSAKSVVVGDDPEAPTTWSSSSTVTTGEELVLYWVHNSTDESTQTKAELELTIDGKTTTKTITDNLTEDDEDIICSYVIDTSSYLEGTEIDWRVRTAGVTKVYGDWSVQRHVDIYAPPTLELKLTDVNSNVVTELNSFPLYVSGLAGPNTQAAIGYYLTVTANEMYETTDNLGNAKTVNAGDQVYSKYFDITGSLLAELSANNIDLENGINYTVTCTVSMNSGLTAEASSEITVNWTDVYYSVNATIAIDNDTMSAYVTPYCENVSYSWYKVNKDGDTYTVTSEVLSCVYGEPIQNGVTTTGEVVYYGSSGDEDDIYYCMVEKTEEVTDVELALYRREFDGSFTELATGLDVTKHTTVTDPHPALDYARYRVVAISKTTGSVSYYDLPAYYVGCKSVIIQWDEDWTTFETTEESAMSQPAWAGSMLILPYNIDVRDDHQIDVAHISYIGRKRPVSYYGTQLGETATWDVEIAKSDKDTLYALRRLAIWTGDVYIREPSGSGYWASISVSYSQTHAELTIPVSFDITRVEGGA